LSIRSSSAASGRARKAEAGQRSVLAPLHGGNPTPDEILYFLEGAHFDLAHALVGDAELLGQVFERNGLVGEMTGLENAARAIIEHDERSRNALRRLSSSSGSISTRSWLGASSTSQSCQSPESLWSPIGALSEASPPSRRFIWMTSSSLTRRRLAMTMTCSSRRSPSSSAEI
jgi:hypothetical protein